MPRNVSAVGPRNAALLLVGEAPDAEEELHGAPFVGAAGHELNTWLRVAGIRRDETFITNVCKLRPPGNDISAWLKPAKKKGKPDGWGEAAGMWYSPEIADGLAALQAEIDEVQPKCIVALGNTPLWALAGETGIVEWRGSQLVHEGIPTARLTARVGGSPVPLAGNGAALIPMLHPAAVLRQYSWHELCIHDFKHRVGPSLLCGGPIAPPTRLSAINPTASACLLWLESVAARSWVAVDLETTGGAILCFGFASSPTDALVFDLSRYTAAEAHEIDAAMRRMLTRAFVVGQSTWAYDAAWFDWKLNFPLRTDFDTYIAQSVLWPGEPRDLQYLASLYCTHYRKWKAYESYESKLETCALDVCATFEVARELERRLGQRRLHAQFGSRMRYAQHVYGMARRGVLRADERTAEARREVDSQLHGLEQRAADVNGALLNLRSPPQVKAALAKLGVHVLSTSDKALVAAKNKHPAAADVLDTILEYRSLAALRANFLSAKPDPDGRLRSQISATGTETFRLTSSKNQFGGGTNLLNITESLRKTIVPDPGYTYFSCDLARADLWPVVWEADDAQLKQAMRDGVDIHLFNCVDLMGIQGVPYDEMFESHPNYPEHLARHEKRRKNSKQFVHLCVDAQHEALTPNGWKRVTDIADGEPILVANLDGAQARFERIDGWFRGPYTGPMLEFDGQSVSQRVTPDHKLSYRTDSRTGFRAAQARAIPQSASLPKAVWADGSVCVARPQLLAAFQADGSTDARGNVTFNLRKPRKIARLRALLEGAEYTCNEAGRFYIPHRAAQDLREWGKTLDARCLHWRHEDACAYLREQVHWDGHAGKSGSQWMSSVVREHAEFAHTLTLLHGYGSQFHCVDGPVPHYRWSFNNRTCWALDCVERTVSEAAEIVYCPITSTGFWLTRRNGKISLTGNTNYGGKARTAGISCRMTTHEAEQAQRRWFSLHPGIKRWHDRTMAQLRGTRRVRNIYGYERPYLGRIEGALPEALAWVPQSTVALIISFIHMAFDECPLVEVQMQCYDSLAGQFPTDRATEALTHMARSWRSIVVPYADPFVVPLDLALSTSSWGECKREAWPS